MLLSLHVGDLSCKHRLGGEAESGIIGSSLDRNRGNSKHYQQQRPMSH